MATISKEVNNTGNGININKDCQSPVSYTVVDDGVNQMAAGWNYLQALECQGSGYTCWPNRWEKLLIAFQNVTIGCVRYLTDPV